MKYRSPWSKDRVAFLTEWFPHFGSYYVAKEFGLTRPAVRAKVQKLGLHMLPKAHRLCVECRRRNQFARYAGLRCNFCHLLRRKEIRRTTERSLGRWVTEAVNMVRCRSRGHAFDLSVAHMLDLWRAQNGRCYYSGLLMVPSKYGAGRNPYSPSIDRVDPRIGYIRSNVVWASWICNAGKSDLSVDEYVRVCRLVTERTACQR